MIGKHIYDATKKKFFFKYIGYPKKATINLSVYNIIRKLYILYINVLIILIEKGKI